MKTTLRVLSLACASLALPAPAQTNLPPVAPGRTAPDKAAPEAKAGPDLASALATLRSTEWHAAIPQLIQLGRSQRMAVLTALGALREEHQGKDLGARARAATDALVRDYVAQEKRLELEQELRAVQAAVDALARTLPAGQEASAAAMAALRSKTESLAQGVATEAPRNLRPLRVPTGRTAPERPDQRPDAEPDGYRRIEVDGKSILVPIKDLPEGTEHEAEFKEGGLYIKRRPRKDGASPETKPAGKPTDQGGSRPAPGGSGK